MPKGGAREGAGRKPGSPNKKTAELQAKVAAEGITPLEYMLTMLRDEHETPANRMWAAEKAAPFIHAKLAAVEHSGKVDSDTTHHVEGAIQAFDSFLAEALGTGEAGLPRGTRTH